MFVAENVDGIVKNKRPVEAWVKTPEDGYNNERWL
jgi:hypothetical protein